MRYYIAYKFLGSDKDKLKDSLNKISSLIEDAGNQTYIFFRDSQNWGDVKMPVDDVIKKTFIEIEKSDALLALVENEEKSEGMLLELGYAKALNKKIILIIRKDITLRFSKSIADKVLEFEDISTIDKDIKSILF